MIRVDQILMLGQNAVVRKVVAKSDAAGNYSSGLQELLATPSCIDMIIRAAVDAVDKHLPEGYVTVGLSVDFSHDLPTSLGMTVNVKAALTEIHGKRLLFKISAWDELGEVGHGKHERMVVEREEILKKAKDRAKFLVQRTF